MDLNITTTRVNEIIELHNEITHSLKMTVSKAIRVGQLLTEEKEEKEHGEFLPLIKTLPFSERTARRYIALYRHRDKTASVADLQEAYKQIEHIESKLKREEQKKKDKLIEERLETGEKPKGWNRSLDYELKKRQEDQDYEDRKEEAFQKEPERGKSKVEDLFEAIIAEAEKDNDIELNDMRANASQGKLFQVIHEYIDSFETISERLEATHNLIKKLKRIAQLLQQESIKIETVN